MENAPYEVNINFNEASRAWHQNKKKQLSGTYKYVCGAVLKNGNFCQKPATNQTKCHIHQ
jgi:hypothetical protein